MSDGGYFSDTYAEARLRFLLAALKTKADVETFEYPRGQRPAKEVLATDMAIMGDEQPRRILLIVSGTHGVEGFCGSGCQIGFMADRLHDMAPPGTRTILVHALNPYGFSSLRRVTEENVDLNRNFMRFGEPLPDSQRYERLHEWLVPEEWEGPKRDNADAALNEDIKARGFPAFKDDVSRGQYTRPTGLFYGGTAPTWSNILFHRILQQFVPSELEDLACIDIHTGLGPMGYGEPIFIGGEDSASYRVTKEWYGSEVTRTAVPAKPSNALTSESSPVSGTLLEACYGSARAARTGGIALEFGTRPVAEVLVALRADHWMHAVPGRHDKYAEAFGRKMRDAFFVDTPAWKAGIYGRFSDMVLRTWRAWADR